MISRELWNKRPLLCIQVEISDFHYGLISYRNAYKLYTMERKNGNTKTCFTSISFLDYFCRKFFTLKFWMYTVSVIRGRHGKIFSPRDRVPEFFGPPKLSPGIPRPMYTRSYVHFIFVSSTRKVYRRILELIKKDT